MTVGELIFHLQRCPVSARIGISNSCVSGWVGVATGLKKTMTTDGLVISIDNDYGDNFLNPDNHDDETKLENI